jgi:hypothetical protein
MGLRHLGVVLLLGGACTSTGAAGANSLIFTTDEPPGSNCPAGGVRLDHGQDLDDNGILQGNEITGTGFVCDGPVGSMGGMGTVGRPALIAVTNESAGSNCPLVGGKRIDYGVDDNGNGTLDTGEIDGTSYVCNGATGAAGAKSLMAVDNVVAGNCAGGGQRIRYGIDDDGNNTLDSGEVDGTSYVCDGVTPTAQINALDTRVTTLEGRRLHTANITNAATPVVNSTSDAWISTVTHPGVRHRRGELRQRHLQQRTDLLRPAGDVPGHLGVGLDLDHLHVADTGDAFCGVQRQHLHGPLGRDVQPALRAFLARGDAGRGVMPSSRMPSACAR